MSIVASMMTMRALITRAAAGKGAYGSVGPNMNYQPVGDGVPCYIWIESDVEQIDGKSVSVETMRGYFRKDADVKREDIIERVVNRNGDVVYQGPISVDAVAPKVSGAIVSHLLVSLTRSRGT